MGDAAVGEVVTPNRMHRTVYRGDDHRIARVLWVGVREFVRTLLAGPGIAAAWALYGLWWRQTPSWGPMRWKPIAVIAGGAVPVLLVIIGAVIWMHSDVPLVGWYAMAQVVIAVARLAWLIRAYGWNAVTPTARPGHTRHVAPIQITGIPQTSKHVVIRRKPTAPPPIPIIVRDEGSAE